MLEYPQEVEVTYIVKRERDDLIRFNRRMRDCLSGFLKVAETVPLDREKFFVQVACAAMLLGEQTIAGIKN